MACTFSSLSQKDAIFHLLRRCSRIQSLEKAHALLIITGSTNHHSVLVETIQKYLTYSNPNLAISTCLAVPRPTALFHNLTIRCFSNHGFYTHLLSLYAELHNSSRHRSDEFTFPFVIKACAALSAARTAKEVHCAVLRSGYGGNVGVETALLDMYAKNGSMEASRKVFDRMPERDCISWNAMISGYSSNGFGWEAFETFKHMQEAGENPSGSTFVGLVPLCTRESRMGVTLHGLALKCGAFSDAALAPTLVSMYSGGEDLEAARMVFETAPVKDTVLWNAMISAYAQNGRPDEAFGVFQLMRSANGKPDTITMVSLFSACSNIPRKQHGQSVHAAGIKLGLSDVISVVSALISMYAALQDPDAAQYLFRSAPEKSLLLWNSMISSYLLNGQWCMGLDTFREMQLKGVMPDAISMISVVSACASCMDLHSGKSAHAYGLKNAFDSEINMTNALLAFYANCNQFSYTLKLFNSMQVRNVISWNTLISGWLIIGEREACIASFNQMRREDVQFDMVTLISILPSFCHVDDLALGMSFNALAIASGYHSDVSLANAIISMYANCGDVEASCILFDQLSSKTVVSWNALMTGFRSHNLFSKVMAVFHEMKNEGLRPNSVTLLNLLPVCRSQLHGKSIHAYAIRNFLQFDVSLITSVMSMYARFGNVDSCWILFQMVDKRSVVAWNTMISAYLQRENAGETVACVRKMLEMEVEPDPVTILNLVSVCSHLGIAYLTRSVTGFTIRKGFWRNTSVVNAFIDMYAKFGDITIARYMFDGLKDKDSITWSAIINAYGMHGNGGEALRLFSEMRKVGFEHDGITYVSILSACSHAGLVEEAQLLFKSMLKDYRIEPRMEHFSCMVDLLGRTGHLKEAYDLVKRLPFSPPASMLESLLGACRCHGNDKIREEVGKLLIKLDPQRSSSYVMLSNMYAESGRWSELSRLRFDMEGKGLRKDPGVSQVG